MLIVALSFATSACWRSLARWQGFVAADLIVAAVYLVAGMIVLLVASRQPDRPGSATLREENLAQARIHDPAPMGRIFAAFLDGMEAGVTARRRRRRPDWQE